MRTATQRNFSPAKKTLPVWSHVTGGVFSVLPWSAVLGREEDIMELLDTLQVSDKTRESI